MSSSSLISSRATDTSKMSHAGKDIKFSLKVMVNKKKGKVLFAEVDSSFADVLLSFLTLPLGTIVRILKKHYGDDAPAFGSLTTLYNGLANLDSDHFWTEGAKSILLHPRSSSDAECKKLGLDISDSPPFEYFVCSKECYKLRLRSISMFYDITGKCNSCKGNLIKEVVDNNDAQIVACEDGVFTKTTVSFLITDDLHIMPNAGLSQIVSVLGITDMDEAETILITFGFPNVMDLLKASLTSPTPLSDLIFKKTTKMSSTKRIYEDGTSSISNSKTMNLKLMVQKSTNKLLYAEAEEDFVEFLFSFLIIPLGGVVSLLSRNSNLKPIDSLYKSAADLIHDKYFKNPDAKNRLIKPSIPHGYLSENHILPLTKECLLLAPYNIFSCGWRSSTRFPNGQGSYLKGPRTYKIADDLTVTPFCIISILSGLKDQKIPVSDVKEVMLQIGLKEALSILKASLTSTTALSDALLSQVVKEPSKREV